MEFEKLRGIFRYGNMILRGNSITYAFPVDSLVSEVLEGTRKGLFCALLRQSEAFAIMFNPKRCAVGFLLPKELDIGGISVRTDIPLTNEEFNAKIDKSLETWREGHPDRYAEGIQRFLSFFEDADLEDEEDMECRTGMWLDEVLPDNPNAEFKQAKLDNWASILEIGNLISQHMPRYEMTYYEPDGDGDACIEFDLYEQKSAVHIVFRGEFRESFLEMAEIADSVVFEFTDEGIMFNFGYNVAK